MSKSVGPNMFFILRVYHMTEAEFRQEVEDDRDLIRQGFMGESEFKTKYSMCRLARVLRGLDDEPMPTFHYISIAFQVMGFDDEEEDPEKVKALLRRHFPDQVGGGEA
jgi:hypothetical protein